MKFSREQGRFAVEALPRALRLPAGFEDVDLAILDWIAAYRRNGVPKNAMPTHFTLRVDRDKGTVH